LFLFLIIIIIKVCRLVASATGAIIVVTNQTTVKKLNRDHLTTIKNTKKRQEKKLQQA